MAAGLAPAAEAPDAAGLAPAAALLEEAPVEAAGLDPAAADPDPDAAGFVPVVAAGLAPAAGAGFAVAELLVAGLDPDVEPAAAGFAAALAPVAAGFVEVPDAAGLAPALEAG